MVMSLIRSLFRIIALFSMGALVSLGIILSMPSKAYKSAYTHDEVSEIDPIMIIDKYTLVSESHYKASIEDSLSRLVKKGVIILTPQGPIINESLAGYSVSIIIQSGGGQVALGKELETALNSIREAGLKIHCHVGEAQSMAFYLMVTVCDKVTAKRSAVLMQHRVSYGSYGTTPTTYRMDIELSRTESTLLGVKFDEWHNLVRGEEDHVFNILEIQKYKLVDEWVD